MNAVFLQGFPSVISEWIYPKLLFFKKKNYLRLENTNSIYILQTKPIYQFEV